MKGDDLPNFEKENYKIYSKVTKSCKNFSPSFLSIRKGCEYPFYMFCFLLGTNPKASEQLNYGGKN